MPYTRQYTDRVNWQNSPSLATPLNATNLNKMDAGLSNVDSAVASEFESVEQDISDLQSAVGGAVQDVQVDDVSIVDGNGVAKLDSSDFGTTVVANPSGTPSANLQKLQVGNGIYGIEQVSANVAVSTLAAPLTTLKIGEDEYTVPSGGGGASVYLSDYYSTEERVVGRWTDGRPLYQKSVVQDLTLSASWQNYTSVAGMNVVDVEINKLLRDNEPIPAPFTTDGICSWIIRDGYLKMAVQGSFASEGWVLKSATIKYTKTADTPDSGPTAGNIIYLPTLYSEEEREVGVWTDGKPLYQKTVNCGQVPSNSSSSTSHGVSDMEIGFLVSAFMADSAGTAWETVPSGENSNFRVIVRASGNIQIVTSGDWSGWGNAYVTIQYTKTTDTPGIGTWTPDGQLSHHYMTSEHIVGTWIDGSTLYERTWDLGSDVSLTASNWVDTGINLSQEFGGYIFIVDAKAQNAVGNYRGQIQAAGDSGTEVQILSSGVATTVRYLTLQYTKA